MLPFLKKKQDAGVSGIIIKNRQPDETKNESEQDDPQAGKEACGRAILAAIKMDDAVALCEAIKDLMDLGDSEASESISPHSYEAQNIKAGQE